MKFGLPAFGGVPHKLTIKAEAKLEIELSELEGLAELGERITSKPHERTVFIFRMTSQSPLKSAPGKGDVRVALEFIEETPPLTLAETVEVLMGDVSEKVQLRFHGIPYSGRLTISKDAIVPDAGLVIHWPRGVQSAAYYALLLLILVFGQEQQDFIYFQF